MPIRKELRKFYGREWLTVTRPRILARAGNKCENCKKPHKSIVETYTGKIAGVPVMWWRFDTGTMQPSNPQGSPSPWIDKDGTETILPMIELRIGRVIHVVLTVAHLNNVAGDDRDENLKAWCQWCHLVYDRDAADAMRQHPSLRS